MQVLDTGAGMPQPPTEFVAALNPEQTQYVLQKRTRHARMMLAAWLVLDAVSK